jgi:hypothetical protein
VSDEKSAPTREQRLAAKLRENLRRRKAQARAIDNAGRDRPKDGLPKSGGPR